jgi:hypothetical protein
MGHSAVLGAAAGGHAGATAGGQTPPAAAGGQAGAGGHTVAAEGGKTPAVALTTGVAAAAVPSANGAAGVSGSWSRVGVAVGGRAERDTYDGIKKRHFKSSRSMIHHDLNTQKM